MVVKAKPSTTESEKENFYSEIKAAAESGWCFSRRWFILNGTSEGNTSFCIYYIYIYIYYFQRLLKSFTVYCAFCICLIIGKISLLCYCNNNNKIK